jgi:outer membrane murein-binding lipoprotein Lpp
MKVILAALLVIGIVLATGYSVHQTRQVKEHAGRVQALETRVAYLEQLTAAQQTEPTTARSTLTAKRLDKLQRLYPDLYPPEQPLPSPLEADRLKALEAQVAQLQQSVAAQHTMLVNLQSQTQAMNFSGGVSRETLDRDSGA